MFSGYNANKYDCLGPLGKNHAQLKTRQKGEIFSTMHVLLHRISLKCIVYPLMYQKNAFCCPCFYFILQNRLNLDTRFLSRCSSIRTI